MTAETTQRYHLRLTEHFTVYDPERGAYLFREWPKGAVVTDPDVIAFLEFRDAPCERIPNPEKH